jgi:hypothetical protein
MGKYSNYTIPADMTCPKCGSHDGLRTATEKEGQFLLEGTLDPWTIVGRSVLHAGWSIARRGLRGTWADLDRHETMRDFAILMCDGCRSFIIVCPGCSKPRVVNLRPLNDHLAYFCPNCREESH